MSLSGILGAGSLGDFELGGAPPSGGGGGSIALAGTIAAIAAVTGDLRETEALPGTIAALSSVSGALSVADALSGTIAVVSTVSGALIKISTESGEIDGTSSISGAVILTRVLAGEIDGVSSISNTATVADALYGEIDATGSMSGSLSITDALTGTIPVVSSITGTLRRSKSLAGEIDGIADLTGAPTEETGILAGEIKGSAGLSGHLLISQVNASVTMPPPSVSDVTVSQPNEILPGVRWQGNEPTVLPFIAQAFSHQGVFKGSLGKLLNRPILKSSINGGFHPITLFLDSSVRLTNIVPGDYVTLQEQGGDGSVVYKGIVSDTPDVIDATPSHSIDLDPMVTQLGDTPFCLGGSNRAYAISTDPSQMVRDAVTTVIANGGALYFDAISIPPSGTTGIYSFDVTMSCLDVITQCVQIAGPNFYFFVDETGKVWFQSVDFGKVNYRFAQGADYTTRKRTAPISTLKNYVQVIGGVPAGGVLPIVALYNQSSNSQYGMRAMMPPLQYPNCTDKATLQRIATTVGTQLNRRQVKIELQIPNFGRRITMAQAHGATCTFFEPSMTPFPESEQGSGNFSPVYLVQDIEIDGTKQTITLGDIPLTANDLQYLTDSIAGVISTSVTQQNILTQIPGFVVQGSDVPNALLPNSNFSAGGGGGGLAGVPMGSSHFTSTGLINPGAAFGYWRTWTYRAGYDLIIFSNIGLNGAFGLPNSGPTTNDIHISIAIGDASYNYLGDLINTYVADQSVSNTFTILGFLPASLLAAGGLVDGATYSIGLANSVISTHQLAAAAIVYNDGPVILGNQPNTYVSGGGGGGGGGGSSTLGSYATGTQLGQSTADTSLFIPAFYPGDPNGPAITFNVYDKTSNPYQIDVQIAISNFLSSTSAPGTYNMVAQLRKINLDGSLGGAVATTPTLSINVQPTAQNFDNTYTLSIPMPAAGQYQVGLYWRQTIPVGRFDTISYESTITISQH